MPASQDAGWRDDTRKQYAAQADDKRRVAYVEGALVEGRGYSRLRGKDSHERAVHRYRRGEE